MKIIIADDHALFRDAIAHYIGRAEPDATIFLRKDLSGVMELLLSEEAIDLIMIGFRLPGMNGLAGLQGLKKAAPSVPVILLSDPAEEREARDAMRAGASGYFLKTLPGKIMLQGVYKMLQGEDCSSINNNAGKIKLPCVPDGGGQKNYGYEDKGGIPKPLTQRERQVLGFLSRGASNKEIAEALDLQVVTIKLHVRGICRKLGVKNRTQSALRAQDISKEA